MKEIGMKPGSAKSGGVDDIVASVEDAVRRAYALGRSDAMKRVVELAQADDPGLRAVALLGPAESSRREAVPAFLEAPKEPAPVMEEEPPEAAPALHAPITTQHEARQAALQDPQQAEASSQAEAPSEPAALSQGAPQEPPRSVGNFLADYFYPLGSKK